MEALLGPIGSMQSLLITDFIRLRLVTFAAACHSETLQTIFVISPGWTAFFVKPVAKHPSEK
jgi:hypothetical protein